MLFLSPDGEVPHFFLAQAWLEHLLLPSKRLALNSDQIVRKFTTDFGFGGRNNRGGRSRGPQLSYEGRTIIGYDDVDTPADFDVF